MESELYIIVILLLVLCACLVATVVYLLSYIGLFQQVKVSVGKPDLHNIWVAYKVHTGSYKYCGEHFAEACALAPDLRTISIFYDDTHAVREDELRYAVGLVLSEGTAPSEDLISKVEKSDFKVIEFPKIDHAVMTSFPTRSISLCSIVAMYKVYPAILRYVMEMKLSAHPYLEVCDNNITYYMAPLSRQKDFFVPGVEYTK